jgi:selenocysteine lyase/cysteine desulfurase
LSTEIPEPCRPANIDDAVTAWADLGGATFLNFAGHAAMPRMAVAAACGSAALKGRPVGGDAAGFFDASERVRSSLAQLLGARASDIALTTGAGPGAAIVALGLTWRPGDEVLVLEGDFPVHWATWAPMEAREGLKVKAVRREGDVVDDILQALGPKTRLVSISHVGFDDGALLDAGRLCAECRRRGVLVLLDASQSCGAVPLNVQALDADFVVGVGYKYLLGPWGLGFLWTSAERWAAMRPMPWNWLSQDVCVFSELNFANPAASVEAKRWDAAQMTGPYNINLAAFAASLDQVVAWGPEQVFAHVRQLIERLFSGLPAVCRATSPRHAGERGPFGCFAAADDAGTDDLYVALQRERITVSRRGSAIRVAPHLLNDAADIDRLLAVANEWARASHRTSS